jgi:hypothetical protein
MYYDLTRKVDSEEVTQSTSEFRKLIEELAPKVSGESLQDMLSGLGISLSGQ